MEIILGKIVACIGIKGEVKILSCTDFAKKRYQKGNLITLKNPMNDETIKLEVFSYRFYKGMDIVSFKDYQDINKIEKYVGYEIYITKDEGEVLEDGNYYYCDLIGMEVTFSGKIIGTIVDILDTGANKVLRIKREGKDLLYPFVGRFIDSIDLENKKMVLKPIEGMIE